MKISDTAYDILKWIGRVVLPAVAVLWSTLGETWGLPMVKEISTTIMAIDLFLNSLLGIAQANYEEDGYRS